MAFFYNIHNFITIKVEGEQKRAIDLIDKHYSFFKTDAMKDPEIEVIASEFSPDIKGSVIVDGKYFVKEDSIFCSDNHKIAKWKVWIKNIEGNTKIYFSGNSLFSYLFLFKYILEPVVFYKIAHKGFAFIHSSCIGRKGYAYIFAASKGVGKTSTALRLVNNGNTFFSDEYTIVSKDGIAYSYPNCIHLHSYNIKSAPFLKKNLSIKDKLITNFLGLIYNISFQYANLPYNIEMKKIFSDISFGIRQPVGAVILLNKSNCENIKTNIITSDELINRILIVNDYEMPQFTNYLSALSFSDKSGRIAFHTKRIANNLDFLKAIPCYEIYMPYSYNNGNFLEIVKLLESIKA